MIHNRVPRDLEFFVVLQGLSPILQRDWALYVLLDLMRERMTERACRDHVQNIQIRLSLASLDLP